MINEASAGVSSKFIVQSRPFLKFTGAKGSAKVSGAVQ